VLGQGTGDFGLTRLTMAQTRGKLPPSPHIVFFAPLRSTYLNGFLSRDSQKGVPKLPRFRVSQLCTTITLCSDLRLGWGLKKCYSSNGVSHSTCTHWGRVDSQFLVVRSQTASLIPGLSFCHNLCCRCPNGSCKPILDIYTSINFQ
jgi:hypothetical protein